MSRESVGSRFGFLMMSAGCAIGLGNVWRFPFITGRNGGALFVLLYIGFLILLGFPLLVMELAIGRASRRGIYGAYRDLPEKHPSKWRIPAGFIFFGNVVLMAMYTTVTGWVLYLFLKYLDGSIFSLKTPAETDSFFRHMLERVDVNVAFMLTVCLLGNLVCGLGLRNGVERITKILMSLLFLCLGGLCVYALTLPNAMLGMKFYLMPSAAAFGGNISRAVSDAMCQAFFTLSVGIGGIEIFGSYCDKERSLLGEALVIILLDSIVSLIAGVVIFSTCASFNIDVESGPKLIFITFPQLMNNMPGGSAVGVVFFFFMFAAAMTTVIGVFESMVSFMIDEWHLTRRAAAAANFAIGFLLSLPCTLGFNVWRDIHPLGGKSTFLDLEDWLLSDMFLPIGSILIAIFCTWKIAWGYEGFRSEVNSGKGMKLGKAPYYYLKFVLPSLIVILIAIGVCNRFQAR